LYIMYIIEIEEERKRKIGKRRKIQKDEIDG
jgi:hypothetical protein